MLILSINYLLILIKTHFKGAFNMFAFKINNDTFKIMKIKKNTHHKTACIWRKGPEEITLNYPC